MPDPQDGQPGLSEVVDSLRRSAADKETARLARAVFLRPVENVEVSDAVRAGLDPAKLKDAKDGSKVVTSWIQLARTGTWKGHSAGEFDFDAAVYAEIAKNFARSKNREVPLDFEHASEERDGGVFQKGAPAQGWIKELRYNDDMLEGRVEWNEEQPGLGYVRTKAYKYISPAVMFESIDRVSGKAIGAELVSAALTNRPFLDGMRAVAAKHAAESAALMSKVSCDDASPEVHMAAKKASDGGPDDADGLTEDQKKDAIEKARTKSASAVDMRTAATKVARMSVSYTAIISALCKEICEEFGWDSWVVEVYDDSVIFQRKDRLWSVGYVFDGSEAELAGTPVEVRRTYEPVKSDGDTQTATAMSGARTEDTTMPEFKKEVRAALGLAESATDDQVLATITARDAEYGAVKALFGAAKPEAAIKKLTAESAFVGTLPAQLGLDAGVDLSEIPKRLVVLSTKAAKADELEKTVAEQKKLIDDAEKRVGNAEIDFLVKCGDKYGTPVHETARPALVALRSASKESFEKTYAAALEGMRKGDAPHLMSNVTRPGGELAQPGPETMTQVAADGGANEAQGNDLFWEQVNAEVANAAKAGKTLLRHEAMTIVTERSTRALHTSH